MDYWIIERSNIVNTFFFKEIVNFERVFYHSKSWFFSEVPISRYKIISK